MQPAAVQDSSVSLWGLQGSIAYGEGLRDSGSVPLWGCVYMYSYGSFSSVLSQLRLVVLSPHER